MPTIETLHKSPEIHIPINKAVIDSLKLRIPLSECGIVNPELISATSIYYHALDSISSEMLPPAPYTFVVDGVTFRVSITHLLIYNEDTEQRDSVPFVEIVLTSKLLRERYFEGITKNNLIYFYNRFMEFELFKCSYESFTNAQVSDIDICINHYTTSKQAFVDIINTLYSQTGTKIRYVKNPIIQANSIGINFNSRHTAKPSLPFVKLYHKELELRSKSVDFYNDYLFPQYDYAIRNLTRIEATIKNSKHKTRLERFEILPKFKTLKDLVLISEKLLYNFVQFSLMSYITTQFRTKAPNLSPTDHLIFELMQNCVLKGYDLDSILAITNTFKGANDRATANAKSRMKKRIKDLHDLLINKDLKMLNKLNHNNHVITYLKTLGLKF